MTQSQFSLEYRRDEALAAAWFWLRKRWLWKRAVAHVAILAFICFLIGLMAGPVESWTEPSRIVAAAFVGLLFASGGAVLMLAMMLLLIPRTISRRFDQLQLAGQSTAYTLDDEGLKIDDRVAGGRVTWKALFGWAENARFLLIYRSDCMYYYIPKERIDSGTLEALKARLKATPVPAL